jgi:Protein of unknown function (DUF3040)
VRLTECSGLHGLMEVAVVSLSAHEQRILSCIADELAASDPKLTSTLAVFNRLTRGEELPARQDVDKSRRPEAGHSRRTRRRTWRHRRQRRTIRVAWPGIVAWILISAALITVTIALSHIGHGANGRWRCTQSWPVTCAGQ